MKENIIITLGRQYGSGGRFIGKRLSEKLGFKFYDSEILTLAAKESGIDEDFFKDMEDKPSNYFWSTLALNAGSYTGRPSPFNDMPMNDRLFIIQSDTIKKIAAKESCIIVGRCADRVLKGYPNVVNFFIHSSPEDKLHRIKKFYNVPEEKAEELMIRKDKDRSNYYNHYAEREWGLAENYHMTIDSSLLGIDGTADIMLTFVMMKFGL